MANFTGNVMKVCFTGDVFLGGDISKKSCEGLVNVAVFNNADKRIINLEHPISDTLFIEDKPTLYADSSAVYQLKELKIDAVNLAHNHIQDKGLTAIGETAWQLDNVKIGHFGAGVDITAAEAPYWLTDDVAILGYCEFDKPYLRQIAVADVDRPGINPLRLKKIKHDLDKLSVGKKAILYFHWGMEHVWLPPVEDIRLAKELLEDDRVITIIGMHPHRVQGIIKHSGKKAYMSLGNFIFPNFYIQPPSQLFYPSASEKNKIKHTTRQYHPVFEPTYKKWRWTNRVSLVLEFCIENREINHTYVIQNDEAPTVKELRGISFYFYTIFINFLSFQYLLPNRIYSLLWKLHAFKSKLTWRLQIMWFYVKQLGVKKFSQKALNYVKRKFR